MGPLVAPDTARRQELWEHKVTQETYALKGLSKGYIVKTGMQDRRKRSRASVREGGDPKV